MNKDNYEISLETLSVLKIILNDNNISVDQLIDYMRAKGFQGLCFNKKDTRFTTLKDFDKIKEILDNYMLEN